MNECMSRRARRQLCEKNPLAMKLPVVVPIAHTSDSHNGVIAWTVAGYDFFEKGTIPIQPRPAFLRSLSGRSVPKTRIHENCSPVICMFTTPFDIGFQFPAPNPRA